MKKISVIAQRSKTSNLLLSILFGVVTGAVFWATIRSQAGYSFIELSTIMFGISVISLGSYLTLSFFKMRNVILVVLPLVIYVLWNSFLNLKEHANYFEPYALALFLLFSFAAIGFVVIGITEKKKEAIADGFFMYINKTIEVVIISILIAAALTIVLGMFNSLLYIVDFRLPLDGTYLVYSVFYSTVPFISIHLVCDYKKSIVDQKLEFSIINLLTKLFVGFLFLVFIFLLLYIVALVPSSFDLILSTGRTSGTFLLLLVGNIIIIYFITLFIKYGELTKRLRRVIKVSLTGLLIESLLLNCVSFYAICQRISQYGFTFQRYIVVISVIFFFLLLAFYLYTVIRNLVIKEKLEIFENDMKRFNLYGILVLLAIGFTITVFVDLEKLSLKDHFNRISEVEDINTHLDRHYVVRSSIDAIDCLHEEYEGASLKSKLDILITLSEYSKYHYFHIEEKREHALATLNDLKNEETEQDLKKFANIMIRRFEVENGNNLNKKCSESVEALLEVDDWESIVRFCNY